MLDGEGLAGAGAGVDHLVAGLKNPVEDRGSKVFGAAGSCGRAHLNIPAIGWKRRMKIRSISSSVGGSKLVAFRTGPYSELLLCESFNSTCSTASTRSRLFSGLRRSLSTSVTASIGRKYSLPVER